MDQTYNSSQNDFLWTLLANPADDAHQYNYNLQRLVNDFPQSGILQALLAHSSDEKNLRQASVYFNPKSLYKLINAPASLIGVPEERIIVQNGGRTAIFNHPGNETPQTTTDGENYFSDHTPVESPAAVEEQPVAEHLGDEPVAEAHQPGQEATIAAEDEGDGHLHYTDAAHNWPIAAEEIQAFTDTEQSPSEMTDNAPAWIEEPPAEHEPESEPAVAGEVKREPFDAPFSEPIINYAAGMGRRLPPDPVDNGAEQPIAQAGEINTEEAPAAHADTHTEQDTPVAEPWMAENAAAVEVTAETHDTAAPQHSFEASAEEQDHAETEPVAQHAGNEVPADAEAVAAWQHYDEQTVIENVAAEHERFDEQDAAVEPVTPDHETAEPVQQYRPWEEPAPEPEHREEPVATNASHAIDDEVYDEITEIEPDIISNIAATDYFMFDRRFGEHKEPEPASAPQPAPAEAVNEQPADTDQQDLSKYHDEKMPYSFLWWLDKTRKEHSGVYQPYLPGTAEPVSAKAKSGADELQQQYYENIFHITSVEELDKSIPPAPYAVPPAFGHKRKEQVIIDRFIQEEPQIRPQSSDKLDNENKAKKSSEDRDELVSETLAAIYSDQMLYHKAIASYKKLMLKFPEKSRYFAAKIEQLEKKTN